MARPFNYGKLAEDNYFTNRTKEVKWLKTQINAGINCMLISPRRWGKSSLVLQVSEQLKIEKKKIVFCFVDLYNVRTEKEFLELYAASVLKATNNTFEDAVKSVKSIFKQLVPSISLTPDPASEFEMSFNWKDLKKNMTEVLDMPDKIARQKGIQVIVCVDEFQNISFMDDGIAFQKKLRAQWQKQQAANYILYGSRRHLMMDFFTKSSMPFYRFGEILFLEKIEEAHWIPYITGRFKATGKNITPALAATIAQVMENHPYYVQQLSQVVWQQTTKTATMADVDAAIEELLDQYTILYQKEVDMLTNFQLNFLKALCNKETSFTSSRVLKDYDLGTSPNITRIKASLQNHEIIDVLGKSITFNDPLFEMWLKRRYIKMRRHD